MGDWFSATEAADVTLADVHRGSGRGYAECEELWCLDTDNIPVDREMSPMEAAEWGEVYDEVGDEIWPALCAWVRSGSYTAQGDSDIPVVSDFEDAYVGNWSSFREYADQYVEDTGLLSDVDETVTRYWDYAAFARDLAMDHSVEPDGHGGVYIFRSL